jgi:hypothetical protein
VFRNEEGVAGVGAGDLNDPAEVQRRERLRKKQELQMQFQLKRKGSQKLSHGTSVLCVRIQLFTSMQIRIRTLGNKTMRPGYCSDFAVT